MKNGQQQQNPDFMFDDGNTGCTFDVDETTTTIVVFNNIFTNTIRTVKIC